MKPLLLIGTVAGLLVGCGAGDNTTEAENKAFKEGPKGTVKGPPASAMQAPPNFKSSINDGPANGGQ